MLRSRTTITTGGFFSVEQTAADDNELSQPIQCTDDEIFYQMTQLIRESSNYEDAQVVGVAENQRSFKNFDSLTGSLSKFVQIRPSDEQLLHEQDYILKRKVEVRQNLEQSIKNIDSLMPSGLVSQELQAQR